jgi:hypothetical protein
VSRAPRCRALVALAAAACASYGGEVRRVREALIGRHPAELRECLPVPASVDIEGGVERAVYRWTPIEPRTEVVIQSYEGNVTPAQRTRELRDFLLSGKRPKHHEYCQLTLELQHTRVQAVHVEGRDEHQLNADDRCLLRLRECATSDSPAG